MRRHSLVRAQELVVLSTLPGLVWVMQPAYTPVPCVTPDTVLRAVPAFSGPGDFKLPGHLDARFISH